MAYAWLLPPRSASVPTQGDEDTLEGIIHHPVTRVYPSPVGEERVGLRGKRGFVVTARLSAWFSPTTCEAHLISLRTEPRRFDRCTACSTLFCGKESASRQSGKALSYPCPYVIPSIIVPILTMPLCGVLHGRGRWLGRGVDQSHEVVNRLFQLAGCMSMNHARLCSADLPEQLFHLLFHKLVPSDTLLELHRIRATPSHG